MGYKCIICEQYFNLKRELYRHLGSHDIKKIKQDICKSAAQKHNFAPYMKKNTKNAESNSLIESNYQNLLHYVSNCSFVSKNKILKNINNRKSSDVIESKICDICNERLRSQRELQIHIKNHKDFEEKHVVEHYLHLSDSDKSTTDVKKEEKCEDVLSNSPQNITIKKEEIMEGYEEFNNVEVSALRKGPITGYYEDFSKSLGGTMIKDEQTVKFYDGYSTSTIKEEEMIKCHKSFNVSQESLKVKLENENHCNESQEYITIKEEKSMEFDEDLSNSQDITIKSEPVTDYHVYGDSNSKNVLNVNDEHTTESQKSSSQIKDFTELDVQEQIKTEYPVENFCDLRNSVKANVAEDEDTKLYETHSDELPFSAVSQNATNEEENFTDSFSHNSCNNVDNMCDLKDTLHYDSSKPFFQRDNDLEHPTAMKTYQCDVCKLQFHVKCELCKHLQSMHEKLSYQCNFCKEGFKVKREFYKHLSSHYFKKVKGLMKPSVKRK